MSSVASWAFTVAVLLTSFVVLAHLGWDVGPALSGAVHNLVRMLGHSL